MAAAATFHPDDAKRLWNGTQEDGRVDPGGEQAPGGPHK